MIKNVINVQTMTLGGLFLLIFALVSFGYMFFGGNLDMLQFLETTQALPNPVSETKLFINIYRNLTNWIGDIDFGLPSMQDANFWEKIAKALELVFTGILKIGAFLLVGLIAVLVAPLLFLVWCINVVIVFFCLLNGTTPQIINLDAIFELLESFGVYSV